VPRQRTARLPLLTSSAGRGEGPSPQTSRALRARLVAIGLVVVSLALITVYLRESSGGVLHGAQRIALSVVAPFEVAGERVSRPFRDAWGWGSDLLAAKDENAKLRKEVEQLRRQATENQTAARDNVQLRQLLRFRDGPRFPDGYTGVATRVIARPPSIYAQEVVVAAGSSDGVKTNDPVVTQDGLVGLVTEVTSNAAKVTLLTDQESAVSAVDAASGAAGIVRRGPSDTSVLVLDRVGKDQQVGEGDKVITAGWKTGKLESLYPRGIPIGVVSGVGQQDVDLYKRIQVTPLVDFDSLDDVIVLVQKREQRRQKSK
jgi:rod shape-determining protein MreC